MNHIKFINYNCGVLLLLIGFICFIFPEWFMALYDTELKTSQSKTEIRSLSGFVFSIGYLFCYFTYHTKNQIAILYSVIIVLLSFVLSRIFGLFVDGFDQTITYYELGFEAVALAIILIVYFKNKDFKIC